MSAVLDAARHYEARAASARLLATHTDYLGRVFNEAITSGADAIVPFPGLSRAQTVSDLLIEGYPKQTALLVSACGLAVAGKYEASSKALLEFVDKVRTRYVANAEDFIADGGE